MKKRNEWVCKALKRRKKETDRGIVDLMMIMHHFFRELPVWIEEMTADISVTLNTYTHVKFDDAKDELLRMANA